MRAKNDHFIDLPFRGKYPNFGSLGYMYPLRSHELVLENDFWCKDSKMVILSVKWVKNVKIGGKTGVWSPF
jgi:hypothetical protein